MRKIAFALLALIVAFAAACSSDGTDSTSSTTDTSAADSTQDIDKADDKASDPEPTTMALPMIGTQTGCDDGQAVGEYFGYPMFTPSPSEPGEGLHCAYGPAGDALITLNIMVADAGGEADGVWTDLRDEFSMCAINCPETPDDPDYPDSYEETDDLIIARSMGPDMRLNMVFARSDSVICTVIMGATSPDVEHADFITDKSVTLANQVCGTS